MKFFNYILILILFVSGCYTMIDHPEVEVYYERDDGEEYLTENYDVFVDEDCTSCHDAFMPQKHFSPLLPAHDYSTNWNELPWWLDTKYLMFFNERNDSSSGSSGYQHVISQQRNDLPPPQQGGYIAVPGGSSSTSSSPTAQTATRANEESEATSISRSSNDSQNPESNSGLNDTSSKRKYRKRK